MEGRPRREENRREAGGTGLQDRVLGRRGAPEERERAGKTTVSRADLSTGIEIKTVYTSKSENTFKSHMKSVANKSGVRFAVFDVSENKSVTDSKPKRGYAST